MGSYVVYLLSNFVSVLMWDWILGRFLWLAEHRFERENAPHRSYSITFVYIIIDTVVVDGQILVGNDILTFAALE